MAKGNFRYLVLSYLLRLEGISDFEGNRPGNHQNSLKSRPGNNKGIKYHRWLLTTLLLWLEFHYRMLGFLEKVLTDFALHGLPW